TRRSRRLRARRPASLGAARSDDFDVRPVRGRASSKAAHSSRPICRHGAAVSPTTMHRHRSSIERNQLELFNALPGKFAVRDAQDLMAYPFFSLSKSRRVAPIDFVSGHINIRVEAVPDHGMATIWD